MNKFSLNGETTERLQQLVEKFLKDIKKIKNASVLFFISSGKDKTNTI